jgi:hypothetical protein
MGLGRRSATRTAAAAQIEDWYRRAMDQWPRRGDGASPKWREHGREPLRIVPLVDPAPPPLDGARPTIAIEDDVVTVDWPAATVTLTGVVATALGPSRPLAPAPPGVFSEVVGSQWPRLLADIRRTDLGPVRHVILPLGNSRFFESVCAHLTLS